ncbi:MAG: NAD(P)H-dependent oxidoreductase [Micrococcaceae bacterium]
MSDYDDFALLFPQYNWGYPAVLKNALDYLYAEWAHKPVSIMCYGNHGGFQGALAMGLVTNGLHMYGMATNPPLDINKTMFDENGQFKDLDTAFAKHQKSLALVKQEFETLLID